MAVAIQTSATTNWSTGNGTLTKPTGTVDNDLLILAVGGDLAASESITYTAPAGFTELLALTRSHATNAGTNLQVWYKVASSEGANYTITPSADNLTGASMLRIDGQHASTPFDVSSITAFDDNTEAKIPSITTTVDNCLIIGISQWDQSKTLTTLPSGWTQQFHIDVSGLDQNGIYKTLATAGATGVAQYNLSAAAPYVSAAISVQPPVRTPPFSNPLIFQDPGLL